jgi:hypothetical protein
MRAAKQAFTSALRDADSLIALSAGRFAPLDTKGLALCGLALCGDPAQIPAAKAAYHAARSITAESGVCRGVLLVFDELAKADTANILAEVRPVAAGAAGSGRTASAV